ncbi:MAG: tRNA (adenosine(37)-N6)-threonylcarbamoyltransferase complex ATPase subunit type 1 TsaE [Eubacterium sp.]|nr:tRNA (adenosine(37)-N6)-threonylcarbamoyltransferase complex ATPase subunit type 1 TsaE [Eubacterium sp.]
MMTFMSSSPEETMDIGRQIASYLKAGKSLLFRGEMGAGKTHLTKGIASYFGADANDVASPTFAIVNEYEARTPIYHFDLFRITNLQDLYAMGFFDYVGQDGICIIEWSENIDDLQSYLEDYCVVEIDKTGDSTRTIVLID